MNSSSTETSSPLGGVFLMLTILMCVFVFPIGLMAIGGTATPFGNLTVFGRSTTLTCEWTSGSQAILVTDTGHRRLVDLGKEKVIPGHHYKILQGPPSRFGGGRTYLHEI